MIVERGTFNVKRGGMEGVVALVLAEIEKSGPPNTRVFTPNKGPRDVLAIEWEFESLAECEKFWADWLAKPETPAFMEKWNDAVERGGTDEIWTLAE